MPKTPCLKPPTFTIEQTQEWIESLNTNGFVVIREAVSTEHAETALRLFKKELCAVSPKFNWGDTSTWVSQNTPMVWGKSSVVFNGFGQSDSNWLLRIKSEAKKAFSVVYGTEELATSFDAFSMFVSESQKSASWLHQDQKKSDTRLSVQGILNILSCGENDAGFICVPKSHVEYDAPDQKSDWVMLPKDHPNQKKAVKILTPPRSLILFHSKLIHANVGMEKNHPQGKHLNRFSAYITFVPKERQSAEIVEKRIRAYHTGIATSHYADRLEEKKIPARLRKRYSEYGFSDLTPTLDADGNIPKERMELI